MTLRLIVTADDLGISRAANEAILRAGEGLVTSVSVLVTGPAAADGIAACDRAGLSLGLHLAFVQARCAADPKDLAGLASAGGQLPSSVFRLLAHRLDPTALRREAEAQYARFVALAGRPPDFVNTHQHAQLLPPVLRAMVDLCRAHGVARVRLPAEQHPLRLPRRLRTLLWPLATAAAIAGRPLLRRAGLRHPDRMIGGPESENLRAPRLRQLLRCLRSGTTELVVHPHAGPAELAALTDPTHQDLLREAGVERIPFDVL